MVVRSQSMSMACPSDNTSPLEDCPVLSREGEKPIAESVQWPIWTHHRTEMFYLRGGDVFL